MIEYIDIYYMIYRMIYISADDVPYKDDCYNVYLSTNIMDMI